MRCCIALSAVAENRALAAIDSQKSLAPFAVLSASYFAHIGFFNPYLPLWLQNAGYSVAVIGLLAAVQSMTRVFAPFAWGWLADRSGQPVRLMRACAAMAMFFSLGLLWPVSVPWLFVVLLLMFTHTSAIMPMSEAAMAAEVSRGGTFDAARYGRIRVWGSIGFLATVLGAGWVFDTLGIDWFATIVVGSLAAVWLGTLCLPTDAAALRGNAQSAVSSRLFSATLAKPEVRWLLASVFFHVLAHTAVYSFFSLLLHEAGYSKSQIGMLWAVGVAAEVVCLLTQGRWFGLLSLERWLLVCAALVALRMVATALGVSSVALMVAAQLTHSLTFATHHTCVMALLTRHFPTEQRGRANAVYTVVAYGVPGVLAGVLGGQLAKAAGLSAVFWAACAAGALAAACAWRLTSLRRA